MAYLFLLFSLFYLTIKDKKKKKKHYFCFITISLQFMGSTSFSTYDTSLWEVCASTVSFISLRCRLEQLNRYFLSGGVSYNGENSTRLSQGVSLTVVQFVEDFGNEPKILYTSRKRVQQ